MIHFFHWMSNCLLFLLLFITLFDFIERLNSFCEFYSDWGKLSILFGSSIKFHYPFVSVRQYRDFFGVRNGKLIELLFMGLPGTALSSLVNVNSLIYNKLIAIELHSGFSFSLYLDFG